MGWGWRVGCITVILTFSTYIFGMKMLLNTVLTHRNLAFKLVKSSILIYFVHKIDLLLRLRLKQNSDTLPVSFLMVGISILETCSCSSQSQQLVNFIHFPIDFILN